MLSLLCAPTSQWIAERCNLSLDVAVKLQLLESSLAQVIRHVYLVEYSAKSAIIDCNAEPHLDLVDLSSVDEIVSSSACPICL